MRVAINGKEREVGDGGEGLSVASLIREVGLDPRFVIVEHNGEALNRARFDDTVLEDGDRVELVRAVAGG